MASNPPKLNPREIWRRVLCSRIEDLRLGFPPDLRGTIQICVRSPGQETTLFHIELNGKRSRSHDGITADPHTWVETTEAKVRAFLTEDSPPPHTFRVIGSFQLYERLFAELAGARPIQSWLATRTG